MKHWEDIAYAAIGVCSTSIGSIAGLFDYSEPIKAVVISGIGAATAWLVKKGLDWLDKKLKKK